MSYARCSLLSEGQSALVWGEAEMIGEGGGEGEGAAGEERLTVTQQRFRARLAGCSLF